MKVSMSFHTEIEKKIHTQFSNLDYLLWIHYNVIIPVFEKQDQYFQNVWPENDLLMLDLIFEYVNLYHWCQILVKFDVNQIWLTTWLFVYVS